MRACDENELPLKGYEIGRVGGQMFCKVVYAPSQSLYQYAYGNPKATNASAATMYVDRYIVYSPSNIRNSLHDYIPIDVT
jgi:hypothetical protein